MIDLKDDDSKIIEKCIDFLYTQQYDGGRPQTAADSKSTRKNSSKSGKAKPVSVMETSPQTPESTEALHTNTALYITGEKYEYVPKYLFAIPRSPVVMPPYRIFQLMQNYRCRALLTISSVVALKTLAKEKYESTVSTSWNCTSFTSSLKLLYPETPETDRLLKDFAIKASASHVRELVKSPEFARLCQQDWGIGFDVLKPCFLPKISDSDSIISSSVLDDRLYCQSYDAYGYD